MILKNYLSRKFIFSKPKKSKILFFDKRSEIFHSYFQKKEFSSLNLDKEINLYILMKLILNFKMISTYNYNYEYIKVTKPKVIISFIDNNTYLFKVYRLFPKIKVVAIQNGIRTKLFFDKLKKDTNLKCDYILTWGSDISKQYKKYINCKTKIIGSFINNKNLKKLKIKKRKSIVWVAPKFHKEKDIKWISKPNYFVSARNFYRFERIMLPKIFEITKKFNKNFEIISKNRGKKFELEKKFYEQMVGFKDFKMIPHKNQNSIYKVSDRVELCLNTTSSFGLECLARQNRVCFLNIKTKDKVLKYLDVFWPSKIKRNGKFWTNMTDSKSLEKVIKYALYSKKNSWKKNTNKLIQNNIFYDKENKIFQNLIKSLINHE
jgi:surface carbohydrate biosynthesis protein